MMIEPTEEFDVVDENDHVLGRLPRSEVHSRGLRHRAVHVFVFRSDGKLLVHLRSPDKEESPGVWTSSACGHVSAGESYDEAARRELSEELGLQSPLRFLQKFSACPDTSQEFTMLYATLSDDPVTVDAAEISAVQWMTVAEIGHWLYRSPEDFSPAFRLLFQWYNSAADKDSSLAD